MIPQSSNHLSTTPGTVYLVGAGPGDPGLITVRGRDLLASSNIVVYDALVNPRLLSHCPDAEKIYVGKRAAAHSMTQEEINDLLVKSAHAAAIVVRLKGGDPFVFGRGGEECEALAAAGVRFEIVPGITAAIAAPAYAGIPVTHRDFNSSFTFLTGHEKEQDYQETEAKTRVAGAGSDIDWSSIAKLPCIAFYMGVKSLPRICARLLEHGMDPAMPAATIQSGTTARQRTVVGTISNLPALVANAGISPPAMTIIGKPVALRGTMNWFETRPLFGQTILVTRARDQASDLTSRLEALGAQVLEAPAIELVETSNSESLREVLKASYDWIIFTSVNGVRFTRQKLIEFGEDVRIFGQAKIAAIGDVTAHAIREQLALRVDVCPERFVAEALADELIHRGMVTGKRFLLLRADIARPLLKDRLNEAGAVSVLDFAIYETRPIEVLPPEVRLAIEENRIDWITFTSSSTVKNFLALTQTTHLGKEKLASIGPITSATMRASGLEPTVEAETFTIDGVVEAMLARQADRSA